jgi:putative transposase
MRWSLIKSYFSRRIPEHEPTNQSRINRRERDIWQRRFWEHAIRDEEDWQNHVNYIHHNPIKHGYVKDLKEWPYSSFHRFVKRGLYDENWGSGFSSSLIERE